jgi:tyrosyl-tRNA synthetase
VGGGTGMIGDPSGRSSERTLQTLETIAENAEAIRQQLAKFLDFEGPNAAKLVNNADWLTKLSLLDFLRDTGKHFSINYMLAKDSVKSRLETGLSFTEFSYMLLQAHDFLELHQREGVTLQIGGSDQWGNITAGLELIRRTTNGDANALTFPLITVELFPFANATCSMCVLSASTGIAAPTKATAVSRTCIFIVFDQVRG